MLQVICQDCELEVVSVEEEPVLRVSDAHWIFNIPLTAGMVAELIAALTPFMLAAAA